MTTEEVADALRTVDIEALCVAMSKQAVADRAKAVNLHCQRLWLWSAVDSYMSLRMLQLCQNGDNAVHLLP